MKRFLLSVFTIAAVAGLAFGATSAFFSDTETSTGNTFAAGELDLHIDNTSYLNGALNPGTTWEPSDLTNQLFFNFLDVKPGDEGEDTVSIHVADNDAWACVDIDITENDDVSCTEPELADDGTCAEGDGVPDGDLTDGDLAGDLEFLFCADYGCNVFEGDETPLTQGLASSVLNDVTWTLADADENNVGGIDGDPLDGDTTYHIGKAWCFGDLTLDATASGQGVNPTVDPGVECNGTLVDDASQSDKLMGDISFYAEQWRNNPNFQCGQD